MAEERTRVDFNAPTSLVERADTIARLLDVSRTKLLIDALRDELEDLANDEVVQSRVREAYYDGQIDVQTVKSVLGTEEAMRMRVLRASLERKPPEPNADELPTPEEFYADDPPQWPPNEDNESDEEVESTS